MNKRITLFAISFCFLMSTAFAQISITSATPYTQDFNTLPTTGTLSANPSPAGWFRYDDPTSGIKDTIRVTAGTATSGGFYSVGTGTSTERAFGLLLSSGTKPLFLGAKFTNNTGSTIVSVAVSYRCEQWRRGNNTSGRADTLLVEYSSSADSVYKGAWTNVPQLMGTSVNTGTTVGSLDGNTVNTTKTFTITGLAVANGGTFWIRFNDYDIFGSEDMLAVDDFSATFATGTVAACTEPAASVTNVVLNASGTTVNGSFTGSTADGYLVVIDSSASTPAVTDASSYGIGQAIGSGKVASNSSSTTFSLGGLVENTIYHAYVFPYNNVSCSGGPNYKLSAPGTDTAKTGLLPLSDCSQPTGVSNSSILKTDSTETTISVSWTNSANGDSVMVIAGPLATIGFVTLHDSAFYAQGSTIPGFPNAKVYYRGTGSSVVLTGLTSNTVYKIIVVAFNNKNCTNGPNYAGLANTTIKTAAGAPGDCVQPTGVSNASILKTDSTSTTISINWTNSANGDSVMVIAGPLATIGFVTLHDTAFYAQGSTIPGFPNAKVYYRGTGSSLVLTGLTANTVYKIIVVAFNNKNCNNGPNYAGLANTTIKTAAGAPGDCVQPTGVSNASILKTDSTSTTISINWTNSANGDSVMVIAGPLATIGFVTLHDTAFYAQGSTIPGFPNAKVYYRGTGSSLVLTGLTSNTVYKIIVVAFNNKSCNNGPNYAGLASTTIKTALQVGVKYNNAEAEFMLYPNPTNNGSLFVKFKNNLREDATIDIIDIVGRKLSTQKLNVGTEMQSIDVSSLAKGTYILNIIYKGTNNTSTFIVE